MLARPFASLPALAWLTLRMTGMDGLPELESPPPAPGAAPPGRRTVVRNVTVAPSTGFGGDDESVTRTTTGWNAAPVETWPPPATGSSCRAEAATGVPIRV